MRVSVRADVRAVTRDLDRVRKRIVPRVTAQALNRAANAVRTFSVRETAGLKGIKQKPVRERFSVRRASKRHLTATIRVRGYRMPVVKTGKPRQTRNGVRVGKNLIPGAFVAPGRRREGVFKRRAKPRLPIEEQMIDMQPEIYSLTRRNISTVGTPRFRKEFSRALRYQLRRKR